MFLLNPNNYTEKNWREVHRRGDILRDPARDRREVHRPRRLPLHRARLHRRAVRRTDPSWSWQWRRAWRKQQQCQFGCCNWSRRQQEYDDDGGRGSRAADGDVGCALLGAMCDGARPAPRTSPSPSFSSSSAPHWARWSWCWRGSAGCTTPAWLRASRRRRVRASCSARPRSWCCWPVTVHAMAAKLLGENVVLLLCVPELVPALLWSSLHLDRPEQHGYHRGHDQIEQKRASCLPRRRGGGRVRLPGGLHGWAWSLQVRDDFGVVRSFRASGVLRCVHAASVAKATVSCLEEAVQASYSSFGRMLYC